MEVQGDQGKARPLERCPESFRRSLGKFPGGGIFLSSMVVSWASEAVQGWSWGLRAAGWRLESLDGRVLDTSGYKNVEFQKSSSEQQFLASGPRSTPPKSMKSVSMFVAKCFRSFGITAHGVTEEMQEFGLTHSVAQWLP
jgi:hypothetical protein